MTDFDDHAHGKDQCGREGTVIDGEFYTNFELLKALAKALIKKGVVTKQEIKNEL